MTNVFSMNDIRGRVTDSLTTEYAWNVGKALAEWLPLEGSVVLASSDNANQTTVHALIEGVLLQGRDVMNYGKGDQVAAVSAINERQAAGGIFVTHDDLQGMEVITLFDSQGATITADSGLSELRELIEAGNFVPAPVKGKMDTV